MRRSVLSPMFAALVLLAIHPVAEGQDPPSTDVYLAELMAADGGVRLGTPVNLTDRPGYDNQPSFLDEESLLYTAIVDGQADIWLYDLKSHERRRVTETSESEYSPTPIPGEEAISVVRVEEDGTQRLWRFPLGGGEPDLLLPNVEPVGYHVWSGDQNLLLFVLGEPNTLQHARRGDGQGKVLAENVGRALHRVPGTSKLSFVHKASETKWTIRSVELETGEMATLRDTRPGREDYVWSSSRDLWMGDGAKLYVSGSGGEGDWREVADFGELGLREITRVAIHPRGTWIAFVAEREAPPSGS